MFEKIKARVISHALFLVIPLSLLLGAPTVSAIHPEQETFGEIDQFVQERMRVYRIPGLALAIVQGDQIVHARGFGRAGPAVAMTPDTPTFIGSVSKPITALAVMQLVERGEIQLDRPVQEYLPWFRVADPDASAAITVRNLLNHTSGLSEVGYFADLPEDAPLRTAVEALRQARPIAPVGAGYHYFNENYQILGLLVETISGRPFDRYVQERIFSPLKMKNSFANPRLAEPAGVAQGYGVLFGFPIPRKEAHPVYGAPSGQIVSTAEDMAHFLIAQLNGGRYAGEQVLSEASVLAMHTPPGGIESGYAMGWANRQSNGNTALTHDGMLMNFSAEAWLLPDQGTGVVILINQTGLFQTMMAPPELSAGVLNILIQAPATTAMPLNIIYSIVAVVSLITMGLVVRWWLVKFPRWKGNLASKSRGILTIDILLEFLLPIVLYFGIPYLFLLQSEKRLSWERGFGLAPDLYALLIFIIIHGVTKGLVKAWVVYQSSRIVDRSALETTLTTSR